MAETKWTETETALLIDSSLSVAQVARKIGRSENAVDHKRRSLMKTGVVVGKPEQPDEHVSSDYGKENGTVSSIRRDIRNVEQLLQAAEVDTSTWEVERHVINKWQVGAKLGKDGPIVATDLWQVKVWLRRRTPIETAVMSILEQIGQAAPILPVIKRAKAHKGQPKRSLEVNIMDPHIGLLCQKPEADEPWDLDIAKNVIMMAMDDLIEKASAFGPFDEVFIPFGNDFVHSDNVFHTTTAGTGQPESISWHHVYTVAEKIAIEMVERLRLVAPSVSIYEIPGNHSRMADFTLARLLSAYFRNTKGVYVDASSDPYKFHRYGCNLIGFEHGHSVKPIRLAALMANERPNDWAETKYREWHLGDQHRKGSSKPSMLEEQGVSVEYIPGLTAPNEWHRLKSFNHQQRGAMAFVWDFSAGPIARIQHNIFNVCK
jgi:hypothetical protein